MRSLAFLLLLCTSSVATAQGNVYPLRRHFLTVGSGVGTGLGGVLSGTTLLQTFRASGVVSVRGRYGIDVTAMRIQTMIPPGGTINDYEYANPEADALMLSFAELSHGRARGFPSVLTLGGGVARRKTSEVGRTRDMWIARAGYDLDPFARSSHLDATVGFNTIFMPANPGNMVYVISVGVFIRIG
jgi:hypothetical protein